MRVFFIVFIVFLLSACKKKDKSIPIICDTSKEFQASFHTYELLSSGKAIATDTIVSSQVLIEADSTYELYEWKVGNDPTIFTARRFSLKFTENELGKTIPIRLIARGQKNICNPNDNGIDTFFRNLQIMFLKGVGKDGIFPSNSLTYPNYMGNWKGAFEDVPTDSFIVSINDNGIPPGAFTEKFFGYRVYNLPKGAIVKQESGQINCTGIVNDEIQKFFGYSIDESMYAGFASQSAGLGCAPVMQMFGKTNNGNIRIECSFLNTQLRIFKGRKL